MSHIFAVKLRVLASPRFPISSAVRRSGCASLIGTMISNAPPTLTLSPGEDASRLFDILFTSAGEPGFNTPYAFSLFVSLHIYELISYTEDSIVIVLGTSGWGATDSIEEWRYRISKRSKSLFWNPPSLIWCNGSVSSGYNLPYSP